MITIITPIYRITRGVARHSIASLQRTQKFCDIATDTPTLEDNWKTGKVSDKTVAFKNVSMVTPRTFTKFFYNEFKLKFVEEKTKSKPGIELLRNIAANYDYWMVRNNQEHLLYYRLEIMLQRLDYLKTVGLDSKQKLRQIQKSPPPLLFTFTNCSFDAKLVYLRGLLSKPDEEDFIHLFHPITNRITANKITIKQRLQTVESILQIKQPAVIRELLNLPCFFMDPLILRKLNHMFIHRFSMPYHYNFDQHTSPVLPPITNLLKLHISADKHLNNASQNDLLSSLPTYQINELLDTTYSEKNGKGTPECLSSFLLRAEFEEDKDRTSGQPLKGRRGFNVPARQY